MVRHRLKSPAATWLSGSIDKIGIDEFLFFAAWSIFEITSFLDLSILVYQNHAFPMMLKLLRYTGYLVFLVCIFFKQIDKSRLIPVCILFLSFALSYFGSHEQIMVLYSLIFISALGIKSEYIIKLTVWIQGVLLFSLVVLSQVGILFDYIFLPDGRSRHCLGFMYTTYPTIFFFFLALEIIYLNRDHLKLLNLAVLEIINIYFYIMTDTNMTFYILTLFIVIIALVSALKGKVILPFGVKYCLLLYPVIMMILSVMVVLKYDAKDEWWAAFDDIVHFRISLGRDALELYGIKAFGSPIEWIGSGLGEYGKADKIYNYVDSSYLQLMLNFGVLFIAAILFIYTFLIYKGLKESDHIFVVILLAILTLALSEPRLLNLTFNPFPILLFSNMMHRSGSTSVCLNSGLLSVNKPGIDRVG